MTNGTDISPEAVEEMAEWCENGGRRRTVRPSEMLRALRASLTARDKALQEIADLDPATDSTEGFNEWGEAECFSKAQGIARAAMEKANG